MGSIVMIAKVSYKKKICILFVLCNIGLSETSKGKCLNECLNGNCFENTGQCVCDPCWDGIKCDQYVDNHWPQFESNEKSIYINRDHIDKEKPIYVAKAHDLDFDLTCGQSHKDCICGQIVYDLKDINFDKTLFKINPKSGELYIAKPQNIAIDYRYSLVISGKSANNNKTNAKTTELHLTVIIQNQLNRIRREAKEEKETKDALMTTNKEPITRQITNFQTTFNLRVLSGEINSLTIGNTIQYRLDVALPRTSGLDLLLELYTKDIVNEDYSPALSLYNITVNNKVAGIGFLTNGAPPKPKMYLNHINNNVYDRIGLDFGMVANNGADGNKMSVFFSVAMVRTSNITSKGKHFITVGAEYNQGSYVWVGVSQVTTEIIPPAEDQKLAEVNVKSAPTIALDSAVTLTAEALLEFRSDNVILEMWGPSHPYEPNNVIAMGQIGVSEFGGNYQSVPNQPQHYLTRRVESQSRLSYQKAILDMGLITNTGEKIGRPSSDSNNKLVFTFSIYATNNKENVGKTAPINLQLTVGNNTVWKQSFEIQVTERKNEKSVARMLASNAIYDPLVGYQGNLITLTLYTEFSEANTFADYSVVVEVPTARKLALLEPCSARLVKEETGINIPYVESKQIEPTLEGNQYIFNFGRIQLIRQRSPSKKDENTLVTQIILKIAFHEENIEGKLLVANVKVISGIKSIKVKSENIQVIAEKKSDLPEIGVKKVVPWDELYVDGAMSVNIDMQLPTSAAYEGVKLEVHGNNETGLNLPEISICRLEVTRVGQSMPCSCVGKSNINKNKVLYEKHNNKNTTFYDYSSISVGDLSVQSKPFEDSERKLNLNFVATILDGTNFQTGVNYPFFVGLTLGQDLIWSSNMTFPMKLESPPDMPSDKKPKLKSYLKDNSAINAGLTTEAVIRLEIPVHTITNYTMEVYPMDDEVSICGIWITHVGRNMPCLNPNIKAEYEMTRIGENNKAVMNFKNIANTGPNYLISPEEELNANTIELTAMFRVRESAINNKFVEFIVKYGQNQLTVKSKLEIPVIKSGAKYTKVFKAPKVFTFDTSDGSRIAGAGISSLLTFDMELEANNQAPIKAELVASKEFEICDASVIKIGSNYPCFSPFDLKKRNSVFDLGMICNTFLNREDIHENKVRLGIAVRFHDDLKDGQNVRLIGQGFVGNSSIGKQQNIDLVVTKNSDQMLSMATDAKIAPKSLTPFPAKIRDKVWIAFNVTIPPKSTLKVGIEVRGVVEENRAVITVHGLRIKSGGVNIICPMANANPALKFDSSVANSQHDIVSADLGYLSNFGFSHAFGSHVAGDDDITVEVLAQFTDHPITDENSDHTIKMTAIFGDSSDVHKISAAKYMRVLRSRSERPIIETEILINNSTVYDRNQVIDATAIIKHSNASTGEPANPSLRLFLPPYLKFGRIVSFNTKDKPIVQNNSIGSTVDIVLQWILFPDVFEVNFTLIVDPDNQRGYGKNETSISTPYRMLCEHFRVSVSSKFPCSQFKDFMFKAKSSECDNALGMANGLIKDCQISASSAISANYAPHLGRYNSGNFWAPSMRFWSQRQYLQVDFLRKTRVTKVVVQSLRNNRKVMAYTLQASDNNKIWFNVNDVSYLSYSEGSATDFIQRPQEARYYRFVVEEASDNNKENEQFIAVRLEFFGCYLEGDDSFNGTCVDKPNTWYSDSSNRLNRHFSADPYNNIIYFCDSTSDMNQQVCYYSNSGGSTWNIIGRSIDTIEGYELSSGKIFAVNSGGPAYLSTKDGLKWTPEPYEMFNQSLSHPKFQHKTVVPGLHKEGLRRMNLKVGNWKALHDGLYFEDSAVPKAYWNKCCKM